jgi:hypothetical protein
MVKDGVVSSECSMSVTLKDPELPVLTLPNPDLSYCANSIINATYNANPTDPDYDDLTTPRPEYYNFAAHSMELDIASSNFKDNCCDVSKLILHWQIDFTATRNPADKANSYAKTTQTSITGTGQPSTYGIDIHFPSEAVDFTDVTHTITYWLEDCNGNISEKKTTSITVKPRPRVTKMP